MSEQITKTIISQLGNKALSMIGARDLVMHESGLQFYIGRNYRHISKVRIILNSMDTYDIYFYRGLEEVECKSNVFFDQLNTVIEKVTGMYTSL